MWCDFLLFWHDNRMNRSSKIPLFDSYDEMLFPVRGRFFIPVWRWFDSFENTKIMTKCSYLWGCDVAPVWIIWFSSQIAWRNALACENVMLFRSVDDLILLNIPRWWPNALACVASRLFEDWFLMSRGIAVDSKYSTCVGLDHFTERHVSCQHKEIHVSVRIWYLFCLWVGMIPHKTPRGPSYYEIAFACVGLMSFFILWRSDPAVDAVSLVMTEVLLTARVWWLSSMHRWCLFVCVKVWSCCKHQVEGQDHQGWQGADEQHQGIRDICHRR